MVSKNVNNQVAEKSQAVHVSSNVENKVFIVPSFGLYGKRVKIGFNLGNSTLKDSEFLDYVAGARSITIKASYDIFTKMGDQLFELRDAIESYGFKAFVSVQEAKVTKVEEVFVVE